MLQSPCKTLGFKKKYSLQNSPLGGGKPYPASGLIVLYCLNTYWLFAAFRLMLLKQLACR